MNSCKPLRSFIILVAGMMLLSCSAIKIETGQTHDEAVESAKEQAKQIRANWANRFQQATPQEMARLISRHVDTITARYIAYGFQVAAQWREGNEGRGMEVPDSEMREIVSVWTERQQPILEAYEDNLEYGIERIKETGYFGEDFLDLLVELADQYYDVHSTVFYPNGTVEEYEKALTLVEHDMEVVSARYKAELDRY